MSPAPPAEAGKNADAWVRDGALAAQEGQWKPALACFEQALKLAPGHFFALFNSSLAHAQLGVFPEALRFVAKALEASPQDTQALQLQEEIHRRSLMPAGRPWKTVLEMVSGGGDAERYVLSASSRAHGELELLPGPEAILVMNWIVALPPPTVDRAGKQLFNAGSLQQDGFLVHMISKDRSGFVFHHAAQGPQMPDSILGPEDVDAMAALLHGKVLSRLVLGSPFPWGAFTSARITAVNRRLAGLGCPAGIETACIPDS
ncbi:MAG: hypothetical protein HZB91_12895 [Elusimicrobia bacterium]|nr:hypothetical protein [Elusimicrobiota bacterium]